MQRNTREKHAGYSVEAFPSIFYKFRCGPDDPEFMSRIGLMQMWTGKKIIYGNDYPTNPMMLPDDPRGYVSEYTIMRYARNIDYRFIFVNRGRIITAIDYTYKPNRMNVLIDNDTVLGIAYF